MEDRARKPDAIDQADARFRNPRTLDELMADVPVITSVDDPSRGLRKWPNPGSRSTAGPSPASSWLRYSVRMATPLRR